MSLAEALEGAASALPELADAIRPANGDPLRLLEELDDAGAERLLGWLLEHSVSAGAELADCWVEESAGVAPLISLDESALPKAGRKTLRRARHRLRSRGVSLPEEDTSQPTVSRLPRVEDEFEAARVSGLDPRGAFLAYWVEARPGGGARLFEALVDEVRGVIEFEVYDAGRSRVRTFLKEIARRPSFPTVEAEVKSVRALVARIASKHPEDRPIPRAFGEWRRRLGDGTDESTPGELARAALPAEPTPALLREAAELVEKGEIGPWPLGSERIGELVREIREQVESPIVVSESQKRTRIEEVVGAAAGDLYANDVGEQTAARLEQTAYVFWRGQRDDAARACLGAASAFRNSPAEENPVARALLEITLSPLLEELRGSASEDEADPASLLVKP